MTAEKPKPQPEGDKPDNFSKWLKKVLPKKNRTNEEKAIGRAKFDATTSGWKPLETGQDADAAKPEGADEERAAEYRVETGKMLDDISKPGGEMTEAETEAMYQGIGGEGYKELLAQGEEIREMWKNRLKEEASAETVKMSPEEAKRWQQVRAKLEEKHGAQISILMHPNEPIKDVIKRYIISLGSKKEEYGGKRFKGDQGKEFEDWIGTPAGEEAMAELILQENPELLTFDVHQTNEPEKPATARILLYTRNDEFILLDLRHVREKYEKGKIVEVKGEQILARAPGTAPDPRDLREAYATALKAKERGTTLYPKEEITKLTDEEADFPEGSNEAKRGYALHDGQIKFKGGKGGQVEQKNTLGNMKADLGLQDTFILKHDGKETVAVFNPKEGEYYSALNPRERVQVFHGDAIESYRDILDFGYAFKEDGTIHFSNKKAERATTLGKMKKAELAKMPESIKVVHKGEKIEAKYDAGKGEYMDKAGKRVKIYDGDKIENYTTAWNDYKFAEDLRRGDIA